MKILRNIKKKSILVALGCLLYTVNVNSQITFSDDVNDQAPAAPIDGMIGLALAVGAYIGLSKKANSKE